MSPTTVEMNSSELNLFQLCFFSFKLDGLLIFFLHRRTKDLLKWFSNNRHIDYELRDTYVVIK